ncbi:uncharacterized protein si:ch211-67e16.4 isoform X3 [Ictalurus punctatus]|uniref:Uncharacterized protein si:ch211-67e16.4 isoform X3 n=1 Tax=Ictalurus punctatus TaxID=7998 RepID=A0A2D0R7V9_ICTPU|nr:uncharacterized protein si:ch211-67e16.4 isoform X3 [Ictalurus punctatus]
MDVNLTISLMRGQMGVVIEKAVNAAVETVLGEMIRVMSLKFEQLRREMTAKEKENEDIRKMLETTRCQMKILRQKYVNALNTKDDRHAFAPHKAQMGQMNTTRHTAGQLDTTRHTTGQLDTTRLTAGQLDTTRLTAGQLDTTRLTAGQLDTTRLTAGQLDTTRLTAGQLDTTRLTAGQLDTTRLTAGQLDTTRLTAGQLDTTRHTAGQLDTTRHTAGQLDTTRHTAGQLDTTRAHQVTADHGVPLRRRSSNTGSPCAEPLTLALKPRNPEPGHTALPVAKTHKVVHEAVPTESCQNAEIFNEEVPGLKVHLGLKVENSSGTVPESINPLWSQAPQTSTDAEHTEIADPNPMAYTSEVLIPVMADCREPDLKIKQEEAEVEIVEVKEEQAEPSTSELPRIELHQHSAGAGIAIELPVTQQCIQIPSVTEPAFMGVDPSTLDRQSSMEKSRRYREKINADPAKKKAMLEARRRRYQERKARGEITSSKLLPVEKRVKLQQRWAESKQRQRRRAKIQDKLMFSH